MSAPLLRERAGSFELDLLGMGQCSIDHVCTVEGLPRLGGKLAMLAYEVLPGGQVATALVAAARLGLRGAFVGSTGSDVGASVALAPLEAAGVDVAGVRGGLARLVGLGARMAVATLGEHGCLARLGEREIASPAFPITPRDTTGAGDVFHAAFAWGLLEGLAPEALLRAANAAAAISCRALGAQGGLPTRAELAVFLRDHEPGPWREPPPH